MVFFKKTLTILAQSINMCDSEKKHPLIEIWNSYPGLRKENKQIFNIPTIENIIGKIFAVGEFYYYVLNLTNSTISSS